MSSDMSSTNSSPIPDLAYDSYKSLSLRDQTLIKRNKLGNANSMNPQPTTGATGAEEPNQHQQQTQRQQQYMRIQENPQDYVTIRGDTFPLEPYSNETLFFWILIILLTILVIINTTLTLFIFGSLRLGRGMESIEFIPTSVLKFFGDTDLDEINKIDGLIQSFDESPMEIMTFEENGHGKVELLVHEGQPSVSVEKSGISIKQVEGFDVHDYFGNKVFSTSTPSLDLPKGVKDLRVKVAKVNRITSGLNTSLELSSNSFTYLKGAEGTNIAGEQISFTGDKDIFLKTSDGSLIFSGEKGVGIYTQSLPLVTEFEVMRNQYRYPTQGHKGPQTKLCVCMPEGKLYRVEIPVGNNKSSRSRKIGCHSFGNPCISKV